MLGNSKTEHGRKCLESLIQVLGKIGSYSKCPISAS